MEVAKPYSPHKPSPKQNLFLELDCLEAFYGGSAGGGKSDALLLAALQYVDVPGYSAGIFRRTLKDLNLPGSIKSRADAWFGGTRAAWDPEIYGYRFKTLPGQPDATIIFGYLGTEADKYRYQGTEFQFLAIDEVTHFSESSYRYLFSRLRRLKGMPVPIRMRSAGNPGGAGHCVPFGEVLTPRGWSDIRTLAVGDPVYQVAADGTLEPTHVRQTHRHIASKTLQARARGLFLEATPEHRVAKVGGVVGARNAAFSLLPLNELPGQATILRTVKWVGTPIDRVTVCDNPNRRALRNSMQPKSLTGLQYAALMGWVLSEGWLVERDLAIGIAQMKPHTRARLQLLLDGCGFKYSSSPTGFTIYASNWYDHFAALNLGLCRDKYIPETLKQASIDQMQALMDAMMDGDGHRVSEQSGQYYTASRRLADDFAEIAVKLGYIVSCTSRQRANRDGAAWCVNFKRTKSGGTELLTGQHRYDVETQTQRRSDFATKHGEQQVYCIGVDSHAFVIRQNGSVWVSGNSWVKQRFFEHAQLPSGLTAREFVAMRRKGEELPWPPVFTSPPSSEAIRIARLNGTHAEGARFVPAFAQDNPGLDLAEYELSLLQLDETERRYLQDGDWDAVVGGRFFKHAYFKVVDEAPPDLGPEIRYWDLAGTKDAPGKDPDWSAGVRMAVHRMQTGARVVYITDVTRTREDPGGVEAHVRGVAEQDGKGVGVWFEEEPGSAGKNNTHSYATRVLFGWTVNGHRKTGPKSEYWKALSAAGRNGMLCLVRAPWNREFMEELCALTGDDSHSHDDMADAAAGAFAMLTQEDGLDWLAMMTSNVE